MGIYPWTRVDTREWITRKKCINLHPPKNVKVKLLRKINSKKLNYDEKSKKVFSSAKIKQQIKRICQEKKWNGS